MEAVENLRQKVYDEGYAFVSEWLPECSTSQVAGRLGSVLNIEKFLPKSGIGDVQKLKPREPAKELLNQYSGSYGYDEFPFHSDLAHWSLPPRYLLLRCVVGSRDVLTSLLPFSIFEEKMGVRKLSFALVAPRRKSIAQRICPVPVKFKFGVESVYRWDSLFLIPLNDSSREAYRVMSSTVWGREEVVPTCLEKAGDTLIIDNWKLLHSRSRVPSASANREIDRVYLQKLG